MHRSIRHGVSLICLAALLGGCTQPGETTGVSAATGGVIGAGLGAIVGSQTGSAGGGLVLGAVAGSATGAAIGNAIEGQEQAILAQDEAIERQQLLIASNQRELESLRRNSGDVSGRYANARGMRVFPDGRMGEPVVMQPHAAARWETPPAQPVQPVPAWNTGATTQPYRAERAIAESTIVDTSAQQGGMGAPQRSPSLDEEFEADERALLEERAMLTEPAVPAIEAPSPQLPAEEQALAAASLGAPAAVSEECRAAGEEIVRGDQSSEMSDRLFHYRRALRLCPGSADFHVKMAGVYRNLGRNEDAEFELREALKIDPSHSQAQSELTALERVF